MALKIRLARGGAKKRPFYKIVVAEATSPRDGRFVERIGSYNPMLSADHPERVIINVERAKYWLSVGAQPSDRVELFFGKASIVSMPDRREQPQKSAPKKKAQERIKQESAAAEAAIAAAETAKREAAEAKVAAAEAAKREAEEAKQAAAAPVVEAPAVVEEVPAETAEAPVEVAPMSEAPVEVVHEPAEEAPAEKTSAAE
jgi:small subunit ribosomal protein S16